MSFRSFQQFGTRLLTIVCLFRIKSDTHNRDQVKISGSSNLDQFSSYSVCMYACLCECSNAKTYVGVCDAILDNGHLLGEAIPSPPIQIAITF